VVASVAPSELTLSWGALKPVETSLVAVAENRAAAAALVDELKFNEGAQN
jgi:iron(III) transport system substrate-binding protein